MNDEQHRPIPRYTYNQVVIVRRGFYRGYMGRVIDYDYEKKTNTNVYSVKIHGTMKKFYEHDLKKEGVVRRLLNLFKDQ
jgi:hypothetical protein